MMSYEEFVSKLKEELEKSLGNEMVKVMITNDLQENNHMNGYGVIIRNLVYNISPVIRLNDFYQDYTKGRVFSNIVNQICEIYKEHIPKEDFDVSKILKFENAKDHIVARLYGTENNAAFLSGKPYTPVEDLVVTYYIHLGYQDESLMSVPITEELRKIYGISTEELHELAMKNTLRIFPPQLQSMKDLMGNLMREDIMREFEIPMEEAEELIKDRFDSELPMYVLTNPEKLYGAISVLSPDTMDAIAKEVGEKFYVIPSSVHECLILPMNDTYSLRELEQMVKEVNLTEVPENDILSWYMYQVDAKHHVFLRSDRAQEYEELLREKEKQKEKQEHIEKQEQELRKAPKPRI